MASAVFLNAIANIEDVLSYKHPLLLHRLQAKEGLDGREATALMEDMLRFLFLCGTSEQVYAPTERIDVAWHHFILFTRDYRQFCLHHFGRLIEHNPTA